MMNSRFRFLVQSALAGASIASASSAVARQSVDEAGFAGAGDVFDAAELVPSAASALPPILPGQEPGARGREGTPGAREGDAPREWFGESPWLGWSRATGDWGGSRTALEELGIDFNGSLVSEWSRILEGADAQRSGFRFLFDANLALDLGRLAGLEGAGVFLDFQTANAPVGGAAVDGFQAYSNISIDGSITQLSQCWYEQWLLDRALRVKIGKVDANSEFAYIGSAGAFINASAGFTPAIFAFPTYPDPSTGVNLFVYPTDAFYAGVGVYDGGAAVDGIATGALGPAGFFDDEDSDDWFVVGEVGTTLANAGPFDQARIAAGFWWHSGEFARFDGGTEDGTTGFYALAEARAWRPAGDLAEDDERGLWAFLQFGSADDAVSAVAMQFGGGVTMRGTFAGRDADAFGVYASFVEPSGDPLAGFSGDETVIELFYEWAVTPSLSIKPDIQWISNPGAAGGDDAIVATLRCTVAF